MKSIYTLGSIACLLALAQVAHGALVDLELVSPTPSRNTIELTITASGDLSDSDTDTTTASGNIFIDLEPFLSNNQTADLSEITLAGGRISIEPIDLSLNFGLAGGFNVESTQIQAQPSTPSPPGTITQVGPAGRYEFPTNQHEVTLNGGTFDATPTGFLALLVDPTSIELDEAPITATTDATGVVIISSPTFTGPIARYDVNLTLPLSFDEVVLTPEDLGQNATVSVAANGTLVASGTLSRVARSSDHVTLAFTNFDEPAIGDTDYVAGSNPPFQELGFISSPTPAAGGVNPAIAVTNTSTTPTSPVLFHRSVEGQTVFDTVSLANITDAIVSLDMQIRDTSYEPGDFVRVFATNGSEEVDLIDFDNNDIDSVKGAGYLLYAAELPDAWTEAILVISSFSNSSQGSERYDFDNIQFIGIPAPPPPIDGDADGNGFVDDDDIAIWSLNFGMQDNATRSDGDMDGDGDVDGFDFHIIQSNFGAGIGDLAQASAIGIPEPGTLLTLASSLMLLIRRKR